MEAESPRVQTQCLQGNILASLDATYATYSSKLRRTNDVGPDFSIPDEPKDVSLITGSFKEWVIGAINESMHCNDCMIG